MNINPKLKMYSKEKIEKYLLRKAFQDKNISPENLKDIHSGFSIVGDFLDKTIIKPNNKNYPSSRNDFVNLLK